MVKVKRTGFEREVGTDHSYVSDDNSSSTLLTNGSVFTGVWEDVSAFESITMAIKTDQNGTFSIQFSPDGTNQDSTLTRYYRTDQIEAPHRFTITRKYARVVFTNDSGSDQTYFRLQTIVGFKEPLNVPIDGIVSQDYDATVVRPTNFHEEVACGKRQGFTTWHKWGYNSDVDTAAPETIWEPGGNPTFLTSAETLDVVSSDANDTSAGTGATAVILYGIDSDRKSQTEVVTMDGTTTVTTSNTWLGLNRVAIYTAGSGMQNAGKITITATTAGTTQATIPVGEGTTQQAIFFTQADHNFIARDLIINSAGATKPEVTIKGWVLSFLSNAKYEVFRLTMDTQRENTITYNPTNPFTVGEKSVLYFTAETDKNNTEVKIRFSGKEVRDADA